MTNKYIKQSQSEEIGDQYKFDIVLLNTEQKLGLYI